MEIGKPYIVTRSSLDGTFIRGDHVTLYENGTIGCREAHGWIDPENVDSAINGWEITIDESAATPPR